MTKKRKQMRKEIHKGTTLCNCWFLVTNCEQRTSSSCWGGGKCSQRRKSFQNITNYIIFTRWFESLNSSVGERWLNCWWFCGSDDKMTMILTLIVDGQGWVSIAGEGTSLRHWTALSTPRPPRAQRPLPRPRWSDLQTFNGDPEKTSFHHNDIVRKSRIITTRFNTTC